MFTRILAPLDGSKIAECILPHLVAIAKPENAQVHLLRVMEPLTSTTGLRIVDPVDWQMRKAEAELYLDGISAELKSAGLQVTNQVLEGKPAVNIIEYAKRTEIDLILLSSHGMSGISPWNVSSVVQQVILRAHRSVMIVRAYHPPSAELTNLSYKKILLPLDGSPRAEMALPVAAALARLSNAVLLVVHVVRRPELPRLTPPSQEDVRLVDQLVERNRDEAQNYLEEIHRRLGEESQVYLEVSDRVAGALHRIAEQNQVELVVLSAHGYSGDSRWPYGSVVVSFIAYGSTPILVLQDLPGDRIEPTYAEIAARETGGR